MRSVTGGCESLQVSSGDGGVGCFVFFATLLVSLVVYMQHLLKPLVFICTDSAVGNYGKFRS